ncbi:MAG: hypothetical protein H5T95_10580 [Firmicutes bacterium]|nr:hypothetical protein [Bacillota bacterium]
MPTYCAEGEYSREKGGQEGYTYVLLGKDWRRVEDGGTQLMQATEPAALPHTKVQTIVVEARPDQAGTRCGLTGPRL